MKLRSRTKAVLKVEKDVLRKGENKVPQILPATEAITASNAASPLLQLPQEVKNMIYEHALPGHQVIHVEGMQWGQETLRLSPCDEDTTEKEAELEFQTCPKDRDPLSIISSDRHIDCWNFWRDERDTYFSEPTLDISLLSSCRQIYHEAKYTLYATNTFSFRLPETLRSFMWSVGRGSAANNLAIRNVHLSIGIAVRQDEYTWNKALSLLVKKLPCLTNVCVIVDQDFRWPSPQVGTSGVQRVFTDPATGNNFFLRGILELRKLPLSGLVCIVAKIGYPYPTTKYGRIIAEVIAEDATSQWTQFQKVEWARFVKAAVLKSG
ncbi:MAG: hypothetical protein ASARMPREDX12_005390 [Alectoria sarmentosa]|nr:MAG: hypothetical protein ASARMPREDX12_005390 [Alectoria sarmentosa]